MTSSLRQYPTQIQARALFDYRDGCLFWKIRPALWMRIGDRAGSLGKQLRRYVRINHGHFLEHRLIYIWHYGELPDLIDHIDRDPTNNRIENLRPLTRSQNQWNQTPRRHAFERDGRWTARIKINGRQIHLGSFDTEEQARDAYFEAKARLHVIPDEVTT